MKDKKIFFIIGGVVLVVILIAVLVVSLGGKGKEQKPSEKIELVWWQPFDDQETIAPLIEAYKKTHPNVTITYVKKDYTNLEEYQNEVVNALANNEGPDIWALRNDWLPKHYKKLAPVPSKVVTAEDYKNKFFPIVSSEMTVNGQIYGIPSSLDTLVLLYNSKHFNEAEIDEPPTTWTDFAKDVEKLTQREGNTIVRAGVACGTANNVSHFFDVLSLLMLQNKTQMLAENKKEVYFNRFETREGKTYYPGTEALKFYTSFALPKKTTYSWNETMKNDREEFINNKVSIIFGYSQDIAEIKKRAPRLSLRVAPVPQVKEGDKIAYGSFWAQVVSRNSPHQEAAWDFLKLYLNKDIIYKYYDLKAEKGELTAAPLKEIAQNQSSKSDLGPIIKQADYATSWYQGDADKMQKIFSQMIAAVIGGQSPQAAIDAAAKNANKMLDKLK